MSSFPQKALIILFLIHFHFSFSQVLINEFCSSNQEVVADEDGDYSDWIELYNAGASAVNIGNYAISDNPVAHRKFILPPQTLVPGEHLLIWASDKNRKRNVHHWETAIYDTDLWKYQVPTGNIAGWTDLSYNDAAWLQGKGGMGFGDDDDSTVIAEPATTVYLRKTFTVTDLSSVAELALHIDYDDGFVAWLNGTRVAGNFLSAIPDYDETASASHEAVMYLSEDPEYFQLSTAALVQGTNVLCIEVHNNSANSSDLTCRPFLSVGLNNSSTQFGALPSWFDVGTTLPIHTNFKISEGEGIYLTNENSVLIDSKFIPSTLHSNQSYGRKPSGGSGWEFFVTPTPDAANTGSSFISYCNDSIIFSKPAGFYSGTQSVSLSGSSQIRYTLDGTEPSASSPLYTSAISVSSTTVIKAICYSSSSYPKKAFVNTYFINEDPSLPVWSISTKPAHFFDYNTGIYELGPNASTTEPYYGANFWEDWKRPVHVEFFESDQTRKISQGADVRIYGNWSRAKEQKSLLLMGKKKYQTERFNYKFYHDKPISSFEDIVLRNSGGDFNMTQFRDGFIQSTVGQFTDLDYQAYRPSLVFINGQYWGIQNIREKIGVDFIMTNHDVPEEEIDLSDTWGDTISGANNIWVLHYMATHLNLSQSTNYHLVADSFDIPNMIDYFATQIYISNWDWPVNNIKFWRHNKGDRKYKYILWDTDLSLGLFDLQTYSFDALSRVRNDANQGPHAEIFRNLLNNTSFRNDFINRSADMMNTVFRPSKFRAKALAYADSIESEIDDHYERWPHWADWNQSVNHMTTFINNRQTYARNQIESGFDLTKQVTVILNVQPAGAGIIKINSIYPDTYPWNGVYYDGVPVTITAIPNPGYTFSYWQSPTLISSPNTNKSVTLNLSIGETMTAYFSGTSSSTKLVISEINYNSGSTNDSGDWLELYNYGSSSVDLTGWELRDGNHYHRFHFPSGTVIESGARLVLAEDLALFQSIHPAVSNVIGSLGFGLSNNGEAIHLLKPNSVSYKSFSYGTKIPWPNQANGNGYTLELTSTSANQNSSSSWTTGCPGGSPGTALITPCQTSVFHEEEAKHLQVYPNPSRGLIELTLPAEQGEWTIEVLDVLGSVQHFQKAELTHHEILLDLSDLKSGVYTLRTTGENEKYQSRIVIVR